MIRYALACEAGHEFESWFRDSAAYDEQRAQGFVACPFCGSDKVEKAIMAPRVARTDRAAPSLPVAVPAAPASEATVPAVVSEKDKMLRDLVRRVHAHLKENADYVGPAFAEEARRMHDGEAESRAIWGEATLEEAKALVEDGIEAMPIPALPDDRN
jgi:hypothetical protein